MSKRTAVANKAIRLAWDKEHELVLKGQGTRDWTEAQQKDILDPEKGKAYDDYGRAFEGQHMKSVEKYPEYQGNPDNIQFLTKTEHLEAHKGNWKKPTNWYYNPITKDFHLFSEEGLTPCTVINLSNPIMNTSINENNNEDQSHIDTKDSIDISQDNSISNTNKKKTISDNYKTINSEREHELAPSISESSKNSSKFKKFCEWLNKPSISIASIFKAVVKVSSGIAAAAAIGYSINNKKSDVNSSSPSDTNRNKNNSKPSNLSNQTADHISDSLIEEECTSDDEDNNTESTSHTTPREHEVSAHSQVYHTKNGPIVKDIEPYLRGEKKDNSTE